MNDKYKKYKKPPILNHSSTLSSVRFIILSFFVYRTGGVHFRRVIDRVKTFRQVPPPPPMRILGVQLFFSTDYIFFPVRDRYS